MEFFHVRFKASGDQPEPGHTVYLNLPTEQRTIVVRDDIAHVSQETYDWLKEQGHHLTRISDTKAETAHEGAAEGSAAAAAPSNPPQLPEGVTQHVVDTGHVTATVTEPTKAVDIGAAVQAVQAGASEKSTDRPGQQTGPSIKTEKPTERRTPSATGRRR